MDTPQNKDNERQGEKIKNYCLIKICKVKADTQKMYERITK